MNKNTLKAIQKRIDEVKIPLSNYPEYNSGAFMREIGQYLYFFCVNYPELHNETPFVERIQKKTDSVEWDYDNRVRIGTIENWVFIPCDFQVKRD